MSNDKTSVRLDKSIVDDSPLLVASNLSKGFSRRRRRSQAVLAVSDVSLRLQRGHTLGIVGESGAGKSTMGRMLLRLVEPDSGTLTFDGVDLLGLNREQLREKRSEMQMIFQDPYSTFDRRMTIEATLHEPLKLHFDTDRESRHATIADLLNRVGLGTYVLHRRPTELSGGQLQRISLARALATGPKLLVCDEAVAALDMSIGAGILNLLLDLQEQDGITMVFISHDLRAIRAISNDVMVMRHGKVVETGDADQIFDAPTEEYTQTLLRALPGRRFLESSGAS